MGYTSGRYERESRIKMKSLEARTAPDRKLSSPKSVKRKQVDLCIFEDVRISVCPSILSGYVHSRTEFGEIQNEMITALLDSICTE
jgi:hypothetical protein